MFQLLALFFSRKQRIAFTVPEFMHVNDDLLIIVCDPSDDSMTVGYHGKMVKGRIKSAEGKSLHIVKDVLSHSRFKSAIDQFLVSIMELLDAPLVHKGMQELAKFLDGALYNIAKTLRLARKAKAERSPSQSNPVEETHAKSIEESGGAADTSIQ